MASAASPAHHDLDENNIILMGPPGAGKTSAARMLGSKLHMPVYDIDDDHLEKFWNCPVSQKLKELGDEGFVMAEGEALRTVQKHRTVISLTGSNPLAIEAMRTFLQQNAPAVLIYMDVNETDIVARLRAMKVDRIVGQSTRSMEEILRWRRAFYERFYDLRVVVPVGLSQEAVGLLVLDQYERFVSARRSARAAGNYISTRSAQISQSLSHVALQGLAPDGGLYVPKSIPLFSLGELNRFLELIQNPNDPSAYAQLALRILERWLPLYEGIRPQLLSQMTTKAYHFASMRWDSEHMARVVPLSSKQADNSEKSDQSVLELFHGPTGSFKDFALQLFPQLFDHFRQQKQNPQQHHGDSQHSSSSPSGRFSILVSTSGDTGSATVDGFCSHTPIPVVVLFPAEGVSAVQKAQMVTAKSDRLHVLAIEKADFDFCQSALKTLFNDEKFTRQLLNDFHLRTSAANSINWGRLVPQIVYHFYGYLRLVTMGKLKLGDPLDVCIPTGNFGNILSALYAKQAGLPLGRLLCASNENDVLTEFIQSGVYDIRSRQLVKTSSPSIDILKSSNLERLLHVAGASADVIRKSFDQLNRDKYFSIPESLRSHIQSLFWATKCSEADTLRTIAETWKKNRYLLDPHTAVAKFAADRYTKETHSTGPMLIYSTAHYAKFPAAVLRALGQSVDEAAPLPQQLSQLRSVVGSELQPPMQAAVEFATTAPVVHTGSCAPELETIKSSILSFFARLYGNQ